ncbi:LysE family translocator [Kushneria phosphatilytica]|uniref:LysE family translocator n=2 Tax=Kushneria phosphatilytica TaxID=657387 RepID=A0A5C1A6V8_9GAMM|nr:LysE family translocator [Kushneria phosphatilytica]
MLMELLPFTLFALAASITPGPTNVLIMASGSRHGLRSTLPLVVGACMGAAGLVLVVGLGLGQLLPRDGLVRQLLAGISIVWLSWLAWQLFTSPVGEPVADGSAARPKRLAGPLSGAGLQLFNPKTWLMALAVTNVFAPAGPERASMVMLLALIFLLVALPCLGFWAWLGARASRWLGSPGRMRRFNRIMAVILLVSSWLALLS